MQEIYQEGDVWVSVPLKRTENRTNIISVNLSIYLSSALIYLIFPISFTSDAIPGTALCKYRAWDKHKEDTGLCPVEGAFNFFSSFYFCLFVQVLLSID